MSVFHRLKTIFIPDAYNPDEDDERIRKGREIVQLTRTERERLQGTLGKKPPETGFFLGDSLTIRREGKDDDNVRD